MGVLISDVEEILAAVFAAGVRVSCEEVNAGLPTLPPLIRKFGSPTSEEMADEGFGACDELIAAAAAAFAESPDKGDSIDAGC